MGVDVILEDDRWDGLTQLAERAVAATLHHLDISGDVVLLGCDDARIAALNVEFRGKTTPTNVLSWPSEDRAPPSPGAQPPVPKTDELGDIALAFETCTREAAEQGKAFDAHVLHLVVHGTLHLLGYDHETDADAEVMEALEVEILGKIDVPNPYS